MTIFKTVQIALQQDRIWIPSIIHLSVFIPIFFKDWISDVHVPEGAIPKDGPSAGISLTSALVSNLTGIPIRHDIAITLFGLDFAARKGFKKEVLC